MACSFLPDLDRCFPISHTPWPRCLFSHLVFSIIVCIMESRHLTFISTASASSSFEMSPTSLSFDSDIIFSQQSSQDILPPPPPPPPPAPLARSAPMTNTSLRKGNGIYQESALTKSLVSPFHDCVESFGTFNSPRFQRPMNGQVNGYVKFNWPRKRERETGFVEEIPSDEPHQQLTNKGSPPTNIRESSLPSDSFVEAKKSLAVPRRASAAPIMLTTSLPSSASSIYSPTLSTKSCDGAIEIATGEQPQLVPPHFGFEARMDTTDRGLWRFCK